MIATRFNQSESLLSRTRYQTAKHLMDVALCLIALPLILPLMVICAFAIYLDSPGSIFFVQERIGKGGRHFKMYKFRTMQPNLDTTCHHAFMKAFVRGEVGNTELGEKGDAVEIYKPVHASQITRVGRFLRKTSLDELPQIINVLKGEMSLVGPRPNVPWEVEEYRLWHYERIEVLPGITGLAQIRGRSSIDFASIVRYDIQYLESQSLTMDLKILWWTVSSVFCGRGAR